MPSTPSMTYNSAGNIRASASLAASGTANYDVDYSAKLEGQITIKNTPGGSVSGTRGVLVEVFFRYSSGPSTTTIPLMTVTLPSAAASTAESFTIPVATGKYNVKITNLDATNAVTVEITGDTVDSIG